jgi:hypothetical protein
MRTRGQKLKQKQAGLPSSPPLQLATPPRRPRTIRKVPASQGQSNNAALGTSSEIIFNSNRPLSPPKTPRHPTALEVSSAVDAKVLEASLAAEDAEALKASFTLKDAKAMLDVSPKLSTELRATSSPMSPGSPQPRAPAVIAAVPHTILHFWLDASSQDLASTRPAAKPSIAMAVPSILVPDLLQYISRLANHTNVYVLTTDAASIGILPTLSASNKRKLDDGAEMPQPTQRVRVEISENPKPKRRRGVFSRMPLQDIDISNTIPTTSVTSPPDVYGSPTTYTRMSRYSKEGNLQLGLIATPQGITSVASETNEVRPAGSNGERRDNDEHVQLAEETHTATQTLAEDEPMAETPRSSRWGFGELLKSARSVSKFLPGFTPRTFPTATVTPLVEFGTPNTARPNPTKPNISHSPTITQAKSLTSTNQYLQPETTQAKEPQNILEMENLQGAYPDRQKPFQKGYRSKTEIQANQKPAGIRIQSEAPNANARENFHDADIGTTPSTKRKRLQSPDITTNPRDAGYGLDLDYLGVSSSDEGEEVITPTKGRPHKNRRLHGPNSREKMVCADANKAQPYTGGFFAPETPDYKGGNVFSDVFSSETARSQARNFTSENAMRRQQSLSPRTPITNLTGSFRVPSPSDSDSDPEDSLRSDNQQASPTEFTIKGRGAFDPGASPRKSSPTGHATFPLVDSSPSKNRGSPTKSSPRKPPTSAPNKAPTAWTQPPPPRPQPSHAALPFVPSGDSEALARARKKALQHLPHKPSGLRASSRISSPRILEDSNHTSVEGNAASTTEFATSGDIDTALTMRSDNTISNKFGQPNTTTNMEGVENLFGNDDYDINTGEDHTNSAVAVGSFPITYVRDPKIEACLDAAWTDEDNGQSSDIFEGLYAQFLAKQ